MSLHCDLAGATHRPYIPLALREIMFKLFHNPAYPGAKVTKRAIRLNRLWMVSVTLIHNGSHKK